MENISIMSIVLIERVSINVWLNIAEKLEQLSQSNRLHFIQEGLT